MNKVILLLVLVGLASALKADAYHNLWSAWKTQYKKTYTATEEIIRFDIFIENIEKINRLNEENESATFGLNHFADLSGTEFKLKYASGGLFEPHTKSDADNFINSSVQALPRTVDWRTKGAVTPVKDQGQCGSCWAFSATGVLEGFYFINNGKLLSFSEQQIVDCDTDYNGGCNGGWPNLAVEYAAKNGLELESDYPYTAQDGSCNFNKDKAVQVAGGYRFVTPKSTNQLKAALVKSPVSVLVQAGQDAFQFYKSGVVTKRCTANLDHAVLAVGYKKIGTQEAFIVKNSWSSYWGQDGYIHIGTSQSANGGQGLCGILAQPMIPTPRVFGEEIPTLI